MRRDDSKALQKLSLLKINLSIISEIIEIMGINKKNTLNIFFSIISSPLSRIDGRPTAVKMRFIHPTISGDEENPTDSQFHFIMSNRF